MTELKWQRSCFKQAQSDIKAICRQLRMKFKLQKLSQRPKLALFVFTSSNCHLVASVEALPAQRYCLPALHFERLAHTPPPISLHF